MLFSNFSATTPNYSHCISNSHHFYLLILAEDHALVLSLLDVEVKEDQEEEVGFPMPIPGGHGGGGHGGGGPWWEEVMAEEAMVEVVKVEVVKVEVVKAVVVKVEVVKAEMELVKEVVQIPVKDTDLVPKDKGGGDGGGYPKDPYPSA